MGMFINPNPIPQSQAGGTSGAIPVILPKSTPQSVTAAVNTAVVVTITASAGSAIHLTSLSFGYNASPTGGQITVVSNAVTIWQAQITAAGLISPVLPEEGIAGTVGQNMVITLAAAGAAVTGWVNETSYYGA